MKPKLIKIEKSTRAGKKLDAFFEYPDGRTKKTSFGAEGYSDYTIHKDKARRERYVTRHAATESFTDPTAASTLALYILWNKPTLEGSIRDYKKRFGV